MKQYHLDEIYSRLDKIDGCIFKKYKTLKGIWSEQKWSLIIDKVQADSSSKPSYIRIRVPHIYGNFPALLYQ